MGTKVRHEYAGDDPPAVTQLSVSDARLIERARRGEASAIRELWQANRNWVAGILLAYKAREADLEDLLQEVAMAVVRNVHSVRSPGAFRPWLRTVAINAARQEARTRNRRPEGRHQALDQEPARAGAEIDMAQTRREEARQLLSMVLDLPEAYREPVLLRSLKGMSYREISAITSLPETTIETRIARGRRMLRERARQMQFGTDTPTRTTQATESQTS